MCRFKIGVIGQYQLIVICIKALLHLKPEDGVRSLTKVNLHPHFRIEFTEWLKKIDVKVLAGERFFTTHNNSLFDAMPVFWQKLSCEARHEVVSKIDNFVANAMDGETIWNRHTNTSSLLLH